MIGSPAPVATPWHPGATSIAAVPWRVRLRLAHAVLHVASVLPAAGFLALDFPLRRIWVILLLNAAAHGATAPRLLARGQLLDWGVSRTRIRGAAWRDAGGRIGYRYARNSELPLSAQTR